MRSTRKSCEKLQVRLCHLQRWVKEKGLRVVIVFEGRDGAGKGGTIRAITERLSPRVFRVVALPGAIRPRKDPGLHAALPAALPRRRRSGHLRSELVQPRRRRARDGLLLGQGAQTVPGDLSAGREVPDRGRGHPDQAVDGSQQRRAETALRSPHRGSGTAVEAQSDGHARRGRAGTTTPARAT